VVRDVVVVVASTTEAAGPHHATPQELLGAKAEGAKIDALALALGGRLSNDA